MRYLVTGADGFIGRHLVRHLVERGHDDTAPVRDGRRISGNRTAPGNLATGAGLLDAVQGADHVIHLAGVTKAADARVYAAINTAGTARLHTAVAAQPHPPRLVYCSSLAASGPGRQRHEDGPPAPVSAYGRSKLGGELALGHRSARIPFVIVRPPIVYGPGDHEFLPRLVAAVRAGLLPAVGRPGPRHYSLIHVDDLYRALITAAESAVSGVVHHVSNGTEHLLDEIGTTATTVLGPRSPRVACIPAPLARGLFRALGRTTMVNPDKVAEAVHPASTCAPDRLPFTPRIRLTEGLTAALRPHP